MPWIKNEGSRLNAFENSVVKLKELNYQREYALYMYDGELDWDHQTWELVVSESNIGLTIGFASKESVQREIFGGLMVGTTNYLFDGVNYYDNGLLNYIKDGDVIKISFQSIDNSHKVYIFQDDHHFLAFDVSYKIKEIFFPVVSFAERHYESGTVTLNPVLDDSKFSIISDNTFDVHEGKWILISFQMENLDFTTKEWTVTIRRKDSLTNFQMIIKCGNIFYGQLIKNQVDDRFTASITSSTSNSLYAIKTELFIQKFFNFEPYAYLDINNHLIFQKDLMVAKFERFGPIRKVDFVI